MHEIMAALLLFPLIGKAFHVIVQQGILRSIKRKQGRRESHITAKPSTIAQIFDTMFDTNGDFAC